uniref:Si:ch211-258f14.2 n=1 Tax=Oryzias latipes TaxID=8090 RepID=A0A3P9IXJ7_ORYLA
MARTGSGTRRNPRLDSFLKRNTDRELYERIRASEPCVVVSDSIHRVYMHVVLSDERVYLTEFSPRTLITAASLRRVRSIQLVNDFPHFLSGKDRERCQHICITYIAEKPEGRRPDGEGLPSAAPPSRRSSYCPTPTSTGYPAEREERPPVLKSTRSASCPNPEALGLVRAPRPPSTPPSFYSTSPSKDGRKTPESSQVTRRFGSVLSRLLRRENVNEAEEKEAELHLYAVSLTSRLYFHLQSIWSSFLIRSTLMLDLSERRCAGSPDPLAPPLSWERTAHLFGQLRSELLRDDIGVESLYLQLQELRTAAHRSVTLRRLFWKSGEVCDFLVQTLEECLHSSQSIRGVLTADQLLLGALIVQTLAIMFRETEVEEARVSVLSVGKGALTSRMLLALICDPQTKNQEPPLDSKLPSLREEYLDAAGSLLFELLLLGHQTSRCLSAGTFLSVGWMLNVLHPHPHLASFISYQTQQLVLAMVGLQDSLPSAADSVLLFQRCRLLLACLQHSSQLTQHLQSHFREEFRYIVKPLCAEKLLPPYPISPPTQQLIEQILTLLLDS